MGIFRKSASVSVDVAAIALECEQGCLSTCTKFSSNCSGSMRHQLVGTIQHNRIIGNGVQRIALERQALSGKAER